MKEIKEYIWCSANDHFYFENYDGNFFGPYFTEQEAVDAHLWWVTVVANKDITGISNLPHIKKRIHFLRTRDSQQQKIRAIIHDMKWKQYTAKKFFQAGENPILSG